MTGPTASQADAGEIATLRAAPGGRAAMAPMPAVLTPSVPLVPRRRVRRRRGPAVLVSVLAHLLLLALVLLLLHRPESSESSGREQSVAMMFEPSRAPTPPGLPDLTRPGGVPEPTTPPVPDAPPAVPPPQAPTAAPAAAAPAPQTPAAPSPPQDEVNLPPPPAPPAPALPEQAPVPVPAAPTATPPPPLLSEQDLAGTIPPPPPPREERPPQREAALSPPLLRPPPTHREAPPPRPRLARPAVPRNSFPAPMNYSFAPPAHAGPQSVARSMLQPPAPSDSEPGLGARTAAGMLETFARAREADPGPDFMASLKTWWLAHRFYPPQAIEAGEDGDVQISLVVDRQGRVTEVQMESRSGSMWLDMAGQSTWRNAKLLPIPDSVGRDRLTIDLTLHYVLMRR